MREWVEEWIANNRGAAVGLGVLAAVVLWGFIFGEGSPLKSEDTAEPKELQGVELRKLLDEAEASPPPPAPETPEEEASRLVDQYANMVEDEPENPNAPAMLVAAGNLQMERLNNPAQAAGFYSRVVYNYPDWEGTLAVYPQLAKALQLSGDQVERQRVLRDMMTRFPPESPEYQYAESELGLRSP